MTKVRLRRIIFNVVLAVTGLFLYLMVWSIPGEAAPINMKFATTIPPTHPMTPIVQEFVKELDKASKGAVTITYHAMETLGKTSEHYEMVKSGLVDIAIFSPTYNPAHFQMTPFLELPFVTTSSRLSYEIIQELLDKNLINSEFTEAQFLLATMNAPAQMFANKKLAKLEDFKGIRFLCMGPVWNKSMGLLGSQCVTMGMPDAYLGLQRGTLDGAANTVAVSLAFKWPEVVKYPTEVSFMGGYVNVFFMNKKSWSKLSPEVQAEWISISKKYGPKMAAVWDGSEDAAKITWEKLGKRVETFPAAEKEKMAKILEPVWLDWIDRMEKGGKPGKEIYQTYVKFMKKNKQPVVVKLPGLYKD